MKNNLLYGAPKKMKNIINDNLLMLSDNKHLGEYEKMKFGFVEKIILSLKDIGIIELVKREKKKPIFTEENKVIRLFLEGKGNIKSSNISRARQSISNKHNYIHSEEFIRKKEKILKDGYLHIYNTLFRALKDDIFHILGLFIQTRNNRKMLFGKLIGRTDIELELESLYHQIYFLEDILKRLEIRLGFEKESIFLLQFAQRIHDLNTKRLEFNKIYNSRLIQDRSVILDKLEGQNEDNKLTNISKR